MGKMEKGVSIYFISEVLQVYKIGHKACPLSDPISFTFPRLANQRLCFHTNKTQATH